MANISQCFAPQSVEGTYGCSTDAGIRIFRTGVVRIRAYKFQLRAYIPAAADISINSHMHTYGCSTLTFFCHVP